MYSPIRHQFVFGGQLRKLGFLVTALSVPLLGLYYVFEAIVPAAAALVVGLALLLFSYLPALTWYYNKITFRAFPFAPLKSVEFKDIYFIAISEHEVCIKAKRMQRTVWRVRFAAFAPKKRAEIKQLFVELEHIMRAAHDDMPDYLPQSNVVNIEHYEANKSA